MRSELEGVYTTLPVELPIALQGQDVVVAGGSIDAALRLAPCCSSVTFVTASAARTSARRAKNLTVLYESEIVCVDGVDRLESVVVRKISTGAVSARNADALFLMKGESS